MTRLESVKSTEDISKIIEILDRDGCIVIEDLLSAKDVERLNAELTPHFTQTPNCHGDFYGYVTKRLSSLIAKSVYCQGMAVNPVILSVMDAILLRTCSQYQLNLTQGIQIGPGEPAQIIHRDDLMFPFPHTGSEWMINCMWAIDDFTLENGATQLVPGSHKWEPTRQPEDSEIIQATMKSGSMLIYMASLLHGGGENRSQKSRTGVVMSYSLGWLRQAENQYLATPLSVARHFPERLQRLIGYFAHEPNLGSVEGQDPILLLQGKDIVNAGFEEFLSEESRVLLREYREGVRKAA
ncbi:MAG: phytanoyl-CoA dioxygenase family protein [Alphaproteobacteria bacterium]|nr:phytanoyl-CoA dioxygenase family protein [Alphaproteobacteria bacterium]MBU0859471.1 phytanoyl-CoA dioxygenase family protein [Alphaproteobacteria bacterium]